MNTSNVTLNPAIKASSEKKYPLYDTPGGIAKRCREENIGISESSIRFLCKSGAIPSIKIGRKTLINWEVFYKYIQSGGTVQKQEKPAIETAVGIIPLPAKIRR